MNIKASTTAMPRVAFMVRGRAYVSDTAAAKALARVLAVRVAATLHRAGNKPTDYKASYDRRRRLEKRAYSMCKSYVKRWLR